MTSTSPPPLSATAHRRRRATLLNRRQVRHCRRPPDSLDLVAAGRRAFFVFLVVLAGVVAAAPPAAAHSVSGVSSSNWATKVLSLQPALPGVSVKSVQLGTLIEITSRDTELIVLGYLGEPYLRIGPGGVFQNLRSPATYLNRTRLGTTPIPPLASDNPATPPRWQQMSRGDTAVFHDHRTHWMGGLLPAPIRADPRRAFTLTPNWHIQLRQGATAATVTGSLSWVPGPNPLPFILEAAGLALLAALIIRTRRWALFLSITLLLLVASDLVHTVGIAATALGGLGAKSLAYLRASFYSFIGWFFAVMALRNLRRRKAAGFLAAGLAGFCVFLLTGLADFATLYRSQAPFVWGIWLDRLTISVALGVGLGVMVTSFVIGRRFVDLDDDDGDLLEPPDLDDIEQWPRLRLLSPHRPPPPPSMTDRPTS